MTFTHALSTNNYGPAKFIVTSSAANGTHTTIASAITAATSGDTIFIRTGTYTEDLTLKAGVNLCAYSSDAGVNDGSGNVIIVGNCTLSTAGTVEISGIQLKTNAANCVTVSGSVASILNLVNCNINCTNNTGISYSSSSASSQLNIYYCSGDLGTTGIGIFAHSSAGTMRFRYSTFSNSGGSSTANTASAGSLVLTYTVFVNPITNSSTNSITINNSIVDTQTQNVTALTVGGTGASAISSFAAGTASAISIGGTMNLHNVNATSSNTNAITGAGSLGFSSITFPGTSSIINTTTQTTTYTNLGKWKATGQPAFLAYLAANDNNRTGNGTIYTIGSGAALTEVFDQDNNFNTNGTFTAPVTGRYQLEGCVFVGGATIAATFQTTINTSNRTYPTQQSRAASAANQGVNAVALTDMDAADTATLTIMVTGEAADTDDILGNATNALTFFSGFLAC